MSNGKVLVICDIQKDFATCFDIEYLKNVKKYMNRKWDKVIVIVDMNMDEGLIPEWMNQKADLILTKHYGGDFLNTKQLADEGDLTVITEDEAWQDQYGGIIITVNNDHETFEMDKDMVEEFGKLKNKNVILIGGAINECLQDIEEALEYFDANVTIDYNVSYGGNPIKDIDWRMEEEIYWVKAS